MVMGRWGAGVGDDAEFNVVVFGFFTGNEVRAVGDVGFEFFETREGAEEAVDGDGVGLFADVGHDAAVQ